MSDRPVADTRQAHTFVLVAVTALFFSCLVTAPLVPLFDPDEVAKVLAAPDAGWLVIDRGMWSEVTPHPERSVVADAKGRMLLVRIGPRS